MKITFIWFELQEIYMPYTTINAEENPCCRISNDEIDRMLKTSHRTHWNVRVSERARKSTTIIKIHQFLFIAFTNVDYPQLHWIDVGWNFVKFMEVLACDRAKCTMPLLKILYVCFFLFSFFHSSAHVLVNASIEIISNDSWQKNYCLYLHFQWIGYFACCNTKATITARWEKLHTNQQKKTETKHFRQTRMQWSEIFKSLGKGCHYILPIDSWIFCANVLYTHNAYNALLFNAF